MIAYLGDTRSRKLLARIEHMNTRTAERGSLGVGQVVLRSRLAIWQKRDLLGRPRRWIYDNGAWEDHVAGRAFDESTWLREIEQISRLPTARQPDFAVLPDRVAGGHASLDLSLRWRERLGHPLRAWYLAVQNGVVPDDVPDDAWIDGIFLGGTTDWKLRTLPAWAEASRRRGWTLHVGRVGTARRVEICLQHGVTSCDSALPLFSEGNWQTFFRALTSPQGRLALAPPPAPAPLHCWGFERRSWPEGPPCEACAFEEWHTLTHHRTSRGPSC